MSLLPEDQTRNLSQTFKAPISIDSINEKVEVFERRLNGSILPFLGLHAALVSLIFLLSEEDLLIVMAERFGVISALGIVLGAVAVFCVAVTLVLQHRSGTIKANGAVALAYCLVTSAGIVTFGVLDTPVAGGVVIAASLGLLTANARGWVTDYEFDTAWVYLPVMYFGLGEFDIVWHLGIALAVYGPAVLVKFFLRPQSGKFPLGISIVIFLGFLVGASEGVEGLVSLLVVLMIILFVVHTIRVRKLTGSSFRYFIGDLIIISLWCILISLMGGGSDLEDLVSLFGFGVAAYALLAIAVARHRGEGPPKERRITPDVDAHLVWLQVGIALAIGQWLIEDVFMDPKEPYGVLFCLIAPAVVLSRWLKAPFLAFASRLAVAALLFTTALGEDERFRDRFPATGTAEELAIANINYANNWDDQLFWVLAVFALGYWASARIDPAYSVPWWRGLVRPRHVALTRRGARLVMDNAARIPILGGLLGAIGAALKWFSLAGTKHFSRDLLMLGVHLYGAAFTVLFLRYEIGCCDYAAHPDIHILVPAFALLPGEFPFLFACCVWGLSLYLRGVLTADFLARFFATGFVAAPLVATLSAETASDPARLAETALASGFTLFLFGIIRHLAKPRRAQQVLSPG